MIQNPGLDEAVDSTNHRGATAEGLIAALELRAAPVHLSWIQLGPWSCADEKGFGRGASFASYSVYPAGILIDPATGQVAILAFTGVDDAGVRLNQAIVAGQLHGGIAQGIGAALLERIHYDENGQLLTGSWMDYGLPRADDLPAFALQDAGIPNSHNPLGAKGVGEPGSIGAPAAVMNAVADAIGSQDIMMPATPERVWRAIDAKENQHGSSDAQPAVLGFSIRTN